MPQTILTTLISIQKDIGDMRASHEEKIGKIHSEITEIKADGKAALVRMEGISKHVTHIEEVIIPKMQDDMGDRPKRSECANHDGLITNLSKDVEHIKENTRFLMWLNQKPIRWAGMVLSSMVGFPVLSNVIITNWKEILTWVGKLL